jgi:hypothetical protein
VREWFEGESLASDLRHRRKESRQGRPVDEALALLETAFDAISYAHSQGEVHLALNPTNLFLAENTRTSSLRTLKVLDFGTAGRVGALGSGGAPSLPRPPTGLRLLFPAYAAPEQLERTIGAIGPWTDVYALALVMMEVLSDRMVMDSSETGVLVERAIDEKRRPTPRSHGLKLPSHIDRALTRALERAPDARHRSASELWRAISLQARVISLPWSASQPPRPSAAKDPAVSATDASGLLPTGLAIAPVAPPAATPANALGPHTKEEPEAKVAPKAVSAPETGAGAAPVVVSAPDAVAVSATVAVSAPDAVAVAVSASDAVSAADAVSLSNAVSDAGAVSAPHADAAPEADGELDAEEAEDKTEVYRAAALAFAKGPPPAIPRQRYAEWLATVKAWVGRVRPLFSSVAPEVARLRDALRPHVSSARTVVAQKLALCLAASKNIAWTRPRIVILGGAAFAFLLLTVLSLRHCASRNSNTTNATSASADLPLPSPLASAPPQEPSEPAVVASPPSNPLDREAALRALDRKWRAIAKCRRGKAFGKETTTITFAEDGSVHDVVLGPLFDGTPTGQCVAGVLSKVHVSRFDGGPAAIDYRVYVAP